MGEEERINRRELEEEGEIMKDGKEKGEIVIVIIEERESEVEEKGGVEADLVIDMAKISEVGCLRGVADQLAELRVVDDILERLVNDLGRIETQDQARRLVGDDDLAECVCHEHAVTQRVQHRLRLSLLGLGHPTPDLDLAEFVVERPFAVAELVDGGREGTGDRAEPLRTVESLRLPIG